MKETGYKGQFFIYDYAAHTYRGEVAQLDICPECYGKNTSQDPLEKKELSIEAEEKTNKSKKAFKDLGDALEKLNSGKPAPEKKERPEFKNGRSKNLDDGKIWALYTGKWPWTLEQIAEEMDCSAATIQKHLKRMREERGRK